MTTQTNKRLVYPHTAVVFPSLGKRVTYTGPARYMTRTEFHGTARAAALGAFDSSDWCVSRSEEGALQVARWRAVTYLED